MGSNAAEKTIKTDQRLDQARLWLQSVGVDIQSKFQDVAGDASFRRYFRVLADGQSRILMDAPPPEGVKRFINIAGRLRQAGLHAPEIVHANRHDGYLLLEDLGNDLYRDMLDDGNVDELFPGLFEMLKVFARSVDTRELPVYSPGMLRFEMDLFPDWYLEHHKKDLPREHFNAIWGGFCETVINSAMEQPQCFVHRDFHSCNLLEVSRNDIGIIDFQDAVIGPVSYDLISLIWDRYIDWPRSALENWIEQFRLNLELDIDADLWLRYCDLMGIQRNIKIVGIFARLHYRDGKKGYLEMIPRFYGYIVDTLRRYPEFNGILSFMEQDECEP